MYFNKQLTYEKIGESSVILLKDCISERILYHDSQEEKQETVGFTYSFLKIAGRRNKVTFQHMLLYLHCTILRI